MPIITCTILAKMLRLEPAHETRIVVIHLYITQDITRIPDE